MHVSALRIGLISLVMGGLVSCSRPGELAQPQNPTPATAPLSLSAAVQGNLKQVVFIQRNTFFSDFTYDGQGRQASVWSYNQRGGEGKADNPQTVLTYNAQGQLRQIEERLFSTDPASGTLTASSSVVRRYELTYAGQTIAMKSTLARSSEYGRADYVYEIDKEGHIARQKQTLPDGSVTESTFLFTNDNVVQQDIVVKDTGGTVTSRTRDTYDYDAYPNPMRGLIAQGGIISVPTYASKNNPLRWVHQTLSPADASAVVSTSDVTYQYTYAGNRLPTNYQLGSLSASFIYNP